MDNHYYIFLSTFKFITSRLFSRKLEYYLQKCEMFLVFIRKYINEKYETRKKMYTLSQVKLGKNYLDIKLSYDTNLGLCVFVRLMKFKKSL